MTTEPTTPDLTDDVLVELEQLLAEDAKLAETITAAGERRETIRAILGKRLPDGTTDLGGTKVIISTPHRLDSAALAKAYPVAQNPEFYKASLDTKAVRERLAPMVLDTYTKAGQRQVTVK